MIDISFKSSHFFKDESVIISLYDNIYYEHLPYLKELLSEFLMKNISNIIFDLSNCLFMEKEIWEYLIVLKDELLNKKCNLVLTGMYGVVKNDYNIMELSNYLESFNNINNAFYNFGILTDIKSA
ncbi:STAS domain-containing protein [uncultured Brachyspira sp.]|uniref:STAS domain-containing protein n=1 Tax=uncultured Brachyspira sp. TaxID=221953 RepID=UPI0025D98646|nr:STAS domain-containing protein [uncultured Brachyspira sp.]